MLSNSNGLTNDQKNPRTEPRYLALRSRTTRLWTSPRYRTSVARLLHIGLQHRDRDVIRAARVVGCRDEGLTRALQAFVGGKVALEDVRRDHARQAVGAN